MVEIYKRRSSAATKDPKTKKPRQIVHNVEEMKPDLPMEISDGSRPCTTFDQLYGCESAIGEITDILDHFKRVIDGHDQKICWPILVSGSKGLGKTSIVEAAANKDNLNFIPISLKVLTEQSRNEFKITAHQILNHCLSSQPALVLIDDLDTINDEKEYKNIIRGVIRRLLDGDTKILVFCTTSTNLDADGDIDFISTVFLKRPNVDARFAILKYLCDNDKNLANLTDECLRNLSIKTPSFTSLDLRKMICKAKIRSRGSLHPSHCDEAIDIVKKSFKKGTHLVGEKPSVTWNDIGGLPEVRHAFKDVMMQIASGDMGCKFAGIALYGPPGCGKTMVAQAMANEAGLNFISIKPAELFNKFLGETEKNIRKVFFEAKEFEPCMIYFDEFDGLCGTRGNKDNITSAIQTLLSEMDGFDGRGTSIILVSTNRLEDIDPAMKRPGRLSKHIYVGPPNEKARKDILLVVAARHSLIYADDVNIDIWAKKTENFTGADLDFLVSEAKLRANISDGNGTGIPVTTLKRGHLEEALREISKYRK